MATGEGARLLVVGHDHVASLGALERPLRDGGAQIEWLRIVPESRHDSPDVKVAWPAAEEVDAVWILGAPWPREQIARWADPEVEWIAGLVRRGVPVVGICFGAQQLARALGGGTRVLDKPRIGVSAVDGAGPLAGRWFHWNAEQVVPPRGARTLATTADGCAAFVVGPHVGLGFHPEMTPELLGEWLTASGQSTAPAVTELTGHEWRARVDALASALLRGPSHGPFPRGPEPDAL